MRILRNKVTGWLNTGDGNDERIVAGTNLVIWAFGASDDLFKGHDGDGYGEIEV